MRASRSATMRGVTAWFEPSDGAPLVLNPAARVLWRSASTVQLELGSRSIVLDHLDEHTMRRLLGLRSAGAPADVATPDATVLDILYCGGFLISGSVGDSLGGSDRDTVPTAAQVPRLAADLAALQVRHGNAATHVLAGRRAAAVHVVGSGRLATLVASLLAAAGVGRVSAAGSGADERVRIADVAPGGVLPEDEGRPAAAAVREAIRRSAPEVQTTPCRAPDLVLLTGCDPLEELADEHQRGRLHGDQQVHLAVRAGADRGVVGPLVVPGTTNCLRCIDLHRSDRDPLWSTLSMQLSVRRRGCPPADVGLTTLTAAIAALQALSWLDGESPAVLGGELAVELPDLAIRRRTWSTHPSCDCGDRTDGGSATTVAVVHTGGRTGTTR